MLGDDDVQDLDNSVEIDASGSKAISKICGKNLSPPEPSHIYHLSIALHRSEEPKMATNRDALRLHRAPTP
jgi:hypothetical protein